MTKSPKRQSHARAPLTHAELLEENRRLREQLDSSNPPGELIGDSHGMRRIYELIRQVAPSDATVLIRGSSGTGKELVANAIRRLSPRADNPFVALNCAALPENLVESELFGHEKGAFTGAVTRRIGRAEAANGGILFLDEIGDLTLATQVKLLRFIQERTFSRIGGNNEIHTDVRIIAATSRNLEELMSQGRFREDLYYRLNIFPITLPDLKERPNDIILLAEHFITRLNEKYHKEIHRISDTATKMLMGYSWPGNVRELENCIERALLTATDDTIHAYNLPPAIQGAESKVVDEDNTASHGETFNELVRAYEKRLIENALERAHGNMSAAARALGLSPRVMHYQIGRCKIDPRLYK